MNKIAEMLNKNDWHQLRLEMFSIVNLFWLLKKCKTNILIIVTPNSSIAIDAIKSIIILFL